MENNKQKPRETAGSGEVTGSIGGLRVNFTHCSLFSWRRQWQPLQYSCLENPMDGGAWWAAVHGVAKSRTQLKRLSSSSIAVDENVLKLDITMVAQLC